MEGVAPARRWTLVAVCTTTFMLLLDITIVIVALPSIQRRLHAGLTGLQWVVDAYALTLAALILTAGALADRYGRRLVFLVGVLVFSTASLLCGLAWSIAVLDIARALQGIGGAALFATALALIGHEYRGPDMGGAIAIWGATVGQRSHPGRSSEASSQTRWGGAGCSSSTFPWAPSPCSLR